MTPSPITIKYLKERIEAVTLANPFFKSAVDGEQEDFDLNVDQFPANNYFPEKFNPVPQDGIIEFSFVMNVVDLVHDGSDVELDVCSRCATAALELYNGLQSATKTGGEFEGEMWRVTKMEGKQKLRDHFSDHDAWGWQVEIYIEAPFIKGTCAIPT